MEFDVFVPESLKITNTFEILKNLAIWMIKRDYLQLNYRFYFGRKNYSAHNEQRGK